MAMRRESIDQPRVVFTTINFEFSNGHVRGVSGACTIRPMSFILAHL